MLNRLAALLWRATGEPIYRRLFGAPFGASINRLNSALGQLRDIRAELAHVRMELDEARQREQQLEGQLRTVIASNWDTTALSRRLAMLEERTSGLAAEADERSGTATPAGHSVPAEPTAS